MNPSLLISNLMFAVNVNTFAMVALCLSCGWFLFLFLEALLRNVLLSRKYFTVYMHTLVSVHVPVLSCQYTLLESPVESTKFKMLLRVVSCFLIFCCCWSCCFCCFIYLFLVVVAATAAAAAVFLVIVVAVVCCFVIVLLLLLWLLSFFAYWGVCFVVVAIHLAYQ